MDTNIGMIWDDQLVSENWLKAVNDHVGKRIRSRRKQLSMSQGQLGEALGLTFQQVQKYEHGSNRISAARLLDMSRALGVPLMYFYDRMPPELIHGNRLSGLAETQDNFQAAMADPDERGETAELVRAFHRIADARVREQVIALLKSLQAPGS